MRCGILAGISSPHAQPNSTGLATALSISAAIDITIDRLVLDARVVSMVGCLICSCDAPMKIFTRLVACLVLAVTALSAVSAVAQTPSGDPVKLRIGFQKSSTLIAILKARGTLERAVAPLNVRIEWGEFASGLPLTEALNAGAVDFSADVADTVPVFAQAANANFVYVAQETPSPSAQAVIVHRDAPIHSLADLKGKRIAVTKAAGSHYLLLAALARAKLSPADVKISYLAPADARAAFERNDVDAWFAWDPYVASVEQDPGARILIRGDGLASYQRYYLASTTFAQAHPQIVDIVFKQLVEAGVWTKAHPQEAAKILAPGVGSRSGDGRARQHAAHICGACGRGEEFRRAAGHSRYLLSGEAAAQARRYRQRARLGLRVRARPSRRTQRRHRLTAAQPMTDDLP